MKFGAATKSRGKSPIAGGRQSKSSSFCSPVMLFSWIVIIGWTAFLVYSWKAGLLLQKIPNGIKYAEHVINETEASLRGSLANIKLGVPVSRLPGGPITNLPEIDRQGEKDEIHVVFSTDCTPYQDWQTVVLFHSATVVGQKGPITRIASGCDDAKKEELTSLYKKLYPQYHVHFTPDFKKDKKTKKSYDFYNKPWGMKHWLENAVPPVPDDIVIALIDPDMIFVRPLTTKIRGEPSNLYDRSLKEQDIPVKVEKGKPVAQMYGLGAPWTNDNHPKFNRGRICGEGSPCLKPNQVFGELHYSVGPPYLVHKQDMERIVETWTKFVPRVYEKYPYLLAEMYAYSMAAAHENLPHLQLENLMVSNTDAGGEGWPLVDKLQDACLPPENGIYYPGVPLPTVVHFCQNFRSGDIGFAKRQLDRKIFSCDHPLLLEPPPDLDKKDYRIHNGEREDLKPRQAKRNGYTLCVIHRSINAALVNFKEHMCGPGNVTNYEKTLNVLTKG